MPETGNLLTVWNTPAPAIPSYPTYQLLYNPDGSPTLEKSGKQMIDVQENVDHRAGVIVNADGDRYYQQFQIELCRSSILYFCNTFCFTFDPRLPPARRVLPFVTFEFQDDLLTWMVWLINDEHDGLSEKSRDMGMTWCSAVVSVWLSVMFEHEHGYFMTLKEDDVDDRTVDSIFGKIRFLISALPEWMRAGWQENKQGVDNKMLLNFPNTESAIKGILSGGTAGRSGRSRYLFCDEFAHIEGSTEVQEAISTLASSNIYMSTPKGWGNEFARMAHEPNTIKKTLHWTLHPQKNEMWHARERDRPRYTDEIWAQEQDISYDKSTTGRVFPQFKATAVSDGEWIHSQIGPFFEWDPHYDVWAGIDLGYGDPQGTVFAQFKPAPPEWQLHTKTTCVIFAEMQDSNLSVARWVERYRTLPYAVRHWVADMRSAKQTQATGITWQTYYQEEGFVLEGLWHDEQGPIKEAVKLMETPGAFAINSATCPITTMAAKSWKFKSTRDKETGDPLFSNQTSHGKFSHIMKAMCYLIDFKANYSEYFENISDEAREAKNELFERLNMPRMARL